ncbi:MAG: type VI secretion system baseplate subunit TssK [Longimicrobiales bacterium]
MHLSQHHFQLQSRFHQDATEFVLASLNPDCTGLIGCEFDHDALRNGVVSILHARGVMPDGLIFRFPEDPPPAPLDVRAGFSPTAQSHLVLLGIPAFHAGRPNCSEAPANGGGTRYLVAETDFPDETTGEDLKSVMLARKNFRLLLDKDETDGLVTLPIARLTRDGSGNFVYDSEFVPSCLQVGASGRILSILGRVVEMLESKAQALASERASGQTGGDSDIAGFWLSHTVQSAIPPLRHHLTVRTSHPEEVFLELARLAGALCTFSIHSDVGQLPVYRHADPEPSFDQIYRHIRGHLDVVVPQNALALPLKPTDPNFYAVKVPDPRAFRQGEWFLGVSSSVAAEELEKRVPRVVKVCSAKHIERLVREAYPGLALELVNRLPTGLRHQAGTQYYRMGRSEPCWQSIVESQSVGVYIPDSIPNPTATLLMLLPE